MKKIEDVIKKASEFGSINKQRIMDAFRFAEEAHAGQTRKSGVPYITHPVAVAYLLAEYKADENSIITALLHDVVEDTPFNEQEVEKRFGKTVRKMVVALTKLPHTNIDARGIGDFNSKIESIRKIFDVMQEDVRVLVIKLCDRLHNMSTLQHFRLEKQQRIAQETLDIYVKIADRLCLYDLKEKLEELCFRFLYPDEYKNVQEVYQSEKKAFLKQKEKILKKLTTKKHLKKALSVEVQKKVPFSDLLATPEQEFKIPIHVYINVESIDDCFVALKEVHELWKNLRGDFKDYITLPKSNGFQALQTTVIRSDSSVLKFIISTQKMHEYSRNGVMLECFNSSKEGKKIHLPWVENLKKIHQKTKQKSKDYMTALQNDILEGSIIIYSNDGQSFFLPPRSTALDAAFYNLGAKAQYVHQIEINGHLRDYSTYLKDGDTIHFITQDKAELTSDWLTILNTTYGKSMFYDLIAKMGPKKKILFGEQILQSEINKRGLGYLQELDIASSKCELQDIGINSIDDLSLKVAQGEISVAKACDLLYLNKNNKSLLDQKYTLEMEFLPNKYDALANLMHTFSLPEVQLDELTVKAPKNNGLVVRALVTFPRRFFDTFQKTLRGIYDVRDVRLKDTVQQKMAKWLLWLFMILCAFDPVIAYYLIQNNELFSEHFVLIRFFTLYTVVSALIVIKNASRKSLKESSIEYHHRNFVYSAFAFFLTAYFTYYSFEQGITPYMYQFTIYMVLFPFFSLINRKKRMIPTLLFLTVSLGIYALYLFYSTNLLRIEITKMIYPVLASLSFTAYTHFSSEFQIEQHIHRRYFSFFKTLSFYGALFAVLLFLTHQPLQFPSLENVLLAMAFSVFFIVIPYILYFIISGIYTSKSSVWSQFVVVLLAVKVLESLFLNIPIQPFEIFIGGIFILAYWAYSKSYSSKKAVIISPP